jgi:transposase
MAKVKQQGKGNQRRRSFDKTFKLEAVRLLEQREKPATQLALELGVERNQLYKWQARLHQHGEGGAFTGPGGKPARERSEVERLRRELAKVTEERDILKKAAAYFAKDRQ